MEARIEVSNSELALMNKLLLTLLNIEDFVKMVKASLEKETKENMEYFIIDDEVSITGTDVDRHIEQTFQSEFNWEDNIPTIIYEKVHEKLDKQYVRDLEAELRFAVNDVREYQRNPLAYHGMSQKDFL